VTVPLHWKGSPLPRHVAIVETAHRRYDFLPQALQRIYQPMSAPASLTDVVLTPLATGGAMAVYQLTARHAQGQQQVVCKIPHERRITYAGSTAHDIPLDTTTQLLERLVSLAERLATQAPGLFPRTGGIWHWEDEDGVWHHVLVEEFIPGISIERLKLAYEQQFVDGTLSLEAYNARCRRLERLAIATFVRLWDALDRHSFTSDPTPWNLLAHPVPHGAELPATATIIDLHSLEEAVGLPYVVQRLATVYGMRRDVVEEALIPGVLDALGAAEGRTLLLEALPLLEDEARKTARNLGVEVYQPLLQALYHLS
jgi:hypothetical protein